MVFYLKLTRMTDVRPFPTCAHSRRAPIKPVKAIPQLIFAVPRHYPFSCQKFLSRQSWQIDSLTHYSKGIAWWLRCLFCYNSNKNCYIGSIRKSKKEIREPLSHATLSKRPKGTSTTLIIAFRTLRCHTQFEISNQRVKLIRYSLQGEYYRRSPLFKDRRAIAQFISKTYRYSQEP